MKKIKIYKYRVVKTVTKDDGNYFSIQQKTFFGWKYICNNFGKISFKSSFLSRDVEKESTKDGVILWYISQLPEEKLILQKHPDILNKYYE